MTKKGTGSRSHKADRAGSQSGRGNGAIGQAVADLLDAVEHYCSVWGLTGGPGNTHIAEEDVGPMWHALRRMHEAARAVRDAEHIPCKVSEGIND